MPKPDSQRLQDLVYFTIHVFAECKGTLTVRSV